MTADDEFPPVLAMCLQVAVPLWIAELQAMGNEEREQTRMSWARDSVTAITAHGDILQFGSKRRGEAAKVFDHLARGLAAGAFQVGGVTFAGLHFEATEPECTGLTARWCPIHGDCACPEGDVLNNPQCWLHSPNSSHPDGRTTSRAARGNTSWPPVVAAAAEAGAR